VDKEAEPRCCECGGNIFDAKDREARAVAPERKLRQGRGSGALAASYRKAKTMTEKLAIIALAVSVGSLLVSIASAVIAWRAKQQARKAATLGQRIEAINHVREALHDLIQDGVVKTKTTYSIRNALHLSAVVFSGRIGRELEQAYTTAYRLTRDWAGSSR
jgi:hypothetical protein